MLHIFAHVGALIPAALLLIFHQPTLQWWHACATIYPLPMMSALPSLSLMSALSSSSLVSLSIITTISISINGVSCLVFREILLHIFHFADLRVEFSALDLSKSRRNLIGFRPKIAENAMLINTQAATCIAFQIAFKIIVSVAFLIPNQV